jgi:hypothetical protein
MDDLALAKSARFVTASFSLTRSCGGIEQGFGPIGAGNLAVNRAGPKRTRAANPLWGAPRIHGELLKLGFEIAESTVSKYMIRHRGPPSQNWRTFLRNHADAIAAIDLLVVPTLTFGPVFGERHLRKVLTLYSLYYNETNLGLAKDTPLHRVRGKQLNRQFPCPHVPVNSCPPTAEGEQPACYRKTRRVDRNESNQGR